MCGQGGGTAAQQCAQIDARTLHWAPGPTTLWRLLLLLLPWDLLLLLGLLLGLLVLLLLGMHVGKHRLHALEGLWGHLR